MGQYSNTVCYRAQPGPCLCDPMLSQVILLTVSILNNINCTFSFQFFILMK